MKNKIQKSTSKISIYIPNDSVANNLQFISIPLRELSKIIPTLFTFTKHNQ